MTGRVNSFGPFMRSLTGEKVHKVNINAGFTCPNRDGTLGTGGCIYCNNESFSPASCRPALSVSEQVQNGIAYLTKRYGARKFLAYFQPFTNTYAPVDKLERLYMEALEEPSIMGLAIGTRPDSVDEEKVALLEQIARENFVLVEYGLQSVYDKSLEFIRRGHDFNAFLRAVDLTKDRGIHIGAHLIAGFPTETLDETLQMARKVSELHIGFLKVHQLQIVKETPLAEIYRTKPFHVFSYDEYIDFIVRFLERLSPRIVIQRLFATAPDHILIAPKWDKPRSRIHLDIEKALVERDTRQGRLAEEKVNI